MDDTMMDLMSADARLRERLEAFAEARLSPDPQAASRVRARVLAVAHRRSALARADAALAILPTDVGGMGSIRRGRTSSARPTPTRWRRAAVVALAASMSLALFVGTTFGAQPNGPLYAARLWIETLTLPDEPSARALAELERLDARLAEAAAASRTGDMVAVAVALAAYGAIVDDASTRAILAGDAVASAALEAGVGTNILVLQALATRLPEQASTAIAEAIERAIERSDSAVEAIDRGRAAGGAGGGGGASGGSASDEDDDDVSVDPGPDATPTPKPTKEPSAKPTKAPTPEPVVEPTKEPKPDRTPPGGQPTDPPGGGKPDDGG